MTSWTSTDELIDDRASDVTARLADWSEATRHPDLDPADVVLDHLDALAFDDIETSRIQGTTATSARIAGDDPGLSVLVVGVHDAHALDTQLADHSDPGVRADAEGVLGPGVAGRFGPFVAQLEALAAQRAGGNLSIDATVATISESLIHSGGLDEFVAQLALDRVDVVIATPAIAWDLGAPTMTMGSRGQLIVEIEVNAGRDLDASAFGGVSRNPLNVLVESIGRLREGNGRIALPGFYHRALPASDAERAALTHKGYDPGAWLRATGAVAPTSGPPALERASLWPSFDVLSLQAGSDLRASQATLPGSARATIAISLVPDQRPGEIEASLRSWIEPQIPDGLGVAIRTLSRVDPHHSDRSNPFVVAQARSLKRTCGNTPIPVVSGGLPGLGQLSDVLNVPLLWAGIAAPTSHLNTAHERLSMQRLRLGIAMADDLLGTLDSKPGLTGRFGMSSFR